MVLEHLQEFQNQNLYKTIVKGKIGMSTEHAWFTTLYRSSVGVFTLIF